MVVSGDLHAARGHVLHRLIDAAVTIVQLVGAVAEGTAEELVTEANTEVRNTRVEDGAQHSDLAVGRRRITGAVGEEDAVRLECLDVGEGRGGGHHVDARSTRG